MNLIGIVEAGGRADTAFKRPVALPVEHDGYTGFDARAHDPPADAVQFLTQGRGLLEHAGLLGAVMRDDRAMESLAAAKGLLHLEEPHGVGAMGHGLPAELTHFPPAA